MDRFVDIYETIQGDTWDMISFKVYGTEIHTPQLMDANPEYRDVAIFSGGTEIIAPDIKENVSVLLPPWKRGE